MSDYYILLYIHTVIQCTLSCQSVVLYTYIFYKNAFIQECSGYCSGKYVTEKL